MRAGDESSRSNSRDFPRRASEIVEVISIATINEKYGTRNKGVDSFIYCFSLLIFSMI